MFGVWGLDFRVWGLELKDPGFSVWFRVGGFVWGLARQVYGSFPKLLFPKWGKCI